MKEDSKTPKLLRGNRVIFVVIFCLALTALLFWNEQRESPISFADINWTSSSIFFLLMAFVCMAFRDLAYMVRIRMLTNNELNWKQAFNVILIWEFASALSPGVIGGTAVAMFILKGEKITLGKSTSIVVVTAIMDNLFYIVALPFLFLFVAVPSILPKVDWIEQSGLGIVWLGYGIIFAVTFILFLSAFFYPDIFTTIVRILFKLPYLNKRKEKGEEIAREFKLASKELKGHTFFFWVKIFLATAWSWISRFLVINFMLMAFMEVGLMDHIIILCRQLIMWLALIIPSTPGGSGLAEYLFGEFLGDFIQNGTLALSLAFLWRLITYYPYLIIGSIIYPRWMKR